MREIKFRAWDKKNECYLCDIQDTYNTLCGCVNYDDDEEAFYDEDCFGDFLDNKRYAVEQYTGIHDSNGQKIYEGDVLECISFTYGNGETKTGNFLVQYHEVSAGFIAGPYMLGELFGIRKCKVVGNVYENPELMEAHNDD